MADNSKIEWTEATWNPVAGCSVLSPGCTNCYAMRLAPRLAAMGMDKYDGLTRKSGGKHKWLGKIKLDNKALKTPVSWKKPKKIFVNSMSDLFHEQVPEAFIKKVFHVMNEASHHQFQVLTKRPERLVEISAELEFSNNVWIGVSVENSDYKWRIDSLRKVPARVRFLSLEPLLGRLENINLDGIHWVIAGGESGPGSRPVLEDWLMEIRDQCVLQSVPFHFKQWGGVNKKKAGRLLEGRTWDQFPVDCSGIAAE